MLKKKLAEIKYFLWKISWRNKGKFTNGYIKNVDGIEIGDYTYGKPEIRKFTAKSKLIIGRFCSISNGVIILVDANHRTDWVTVYPISGYILEKTPLNYGHPTGGDVFIGNDVWFCQNTIFLPGIKIGNGAVISAGAVVTKNVLDYEIVGGVPAKHIGFRFSPDQIEKLLKISWWNWDIEKVKENANLLESSNIDDFIRKYINEK